MLARKKPYYHIDDVPNKKRSFTGSRRFSALLVVALFGAGVYLLVLLQAPDLFISQASAASQSAEEELVNRNQNFIKIERINLMLPFTSDDKAALSSGGWHQYAEKGDPEKGGNFIISAHRFKLEITPGATKEASPFYHLDKLQEKDVINVYYNAKWYSYEVKKVYSADPSRLTERDSSEEAKLTLYSSGLNGSPDGRVVVEAAPVGGPPLPAPTAASAPLL